MTPRRQIPAVPGAGRPRRNPLGLRIVGGRFRGRRLLYSGDPRVRPMKDRLREAIFNRIGPAIEGKHAIDLFAGTGALGLEAISRGAVAATLIERHFPTAEIIRQNVAVLGVEQIARIVTADVFVWQRQRPELGPGGWVVFCSPPYDFYVERAEQMRELIGGLVESAPAESIFVLEADGRFDFGLLPQPQSWDLHHYPPAVVGIHVRPA
jgi:16S rRNA (guanine966-N2)-methyltransferase